MLIILFGVKFVNRLLVHPSRAVIGGGGYCSQFMVAAGQSAVLPIEVFFPKDVLPFGTDKLHIM